MNLLRSSVLLGLAVLCVVLGIQPAVAFVPQEYLFADLTIRVLEVKYEHKGAIFNVFAGKQLSRLTAEIVSCDVDSKERKAAPNAFEYLQKNAKEIDLFYGGHPDDSKKQDLSPSACRKNTFKVRAVVLIESTGVRTFFSFIDPEDEFPIFWHNPQLRDLDPKTRKQN